MKKLLIVLSSADFDNFTRRATVEAICREHEETTLLFVNGIKAFPIKKPGDSKLKWKAFYSFSLGKLETFFKYAELFLKGFYWKPFIQSFDTVFLSDPNQVLLLSYLSKDQKVIYLIRDPNVLQSKKNFRREKAILNRADLVLATSKNLAEKYLPEYYEEQHSNIHFWPNTVDMKVWNYENYQTFRKNYKKPIVGLAGNMGRQRTDINLLNFITKELRNINFEIAGNISPDLAGDELLNEILQRENVYYLGFIPFDELPKTVINWQAGLITEKQNEYASYMHHNKVYQYLALGISVVTIKNHDDYEHLKPYIQTVENYSDYVQALGTALEKSGDIQFQKECVSIAKDNSADKRAEDFLRLVQS